MAQHKWHKEIKAWADGAKIEFYHSSYAKWVDAPDNPEWSGRIKYRIKQQPCVNKDNPYYCSRVRCQLGEKCVDDDMSHRQSQPKEPQYLYVYFTGLEEVSLSTLDNLNQYELLGKIKLEVDDAD